MRAKKSMAARSIKRAAAYDLVLKDARQKLQRIQTAVRVLEEYLAAKGKRERGRESAPAADGVRGGLPGAGTPDHLTTER